MNIKNVKRFIKCVYLLALKQKKYIAVMLVGETGVGKTQVLEQIGVELAEELDMKDFEVTNLRLSQKDQPDLVGIPIETEMVPCPYCIENGVDHYHQELLHEKRKIMEHVHNYHKKELKGKKIDYMDIMEEIRSKYSHLVEIRTSNAVPDHLPKKGHGILFLDEINRGTKNVRDAVFELVLELRLGRYKVPDGWIVVGAINPPSEDFNVYEFDKAMIARYCWILFSPETEEWLAYAADKGLNSEIRQFITENPKFLGNEIVDYPYEPVASPRSNEQVSYLLDVLPEDLTYEVLAGCIGIDAATTFMAQRKDKAKPVMAKDILGNYSKVQQKIKRYARPKKNRADLIRVSIDDLIATLKKRENELTDVEMESITLFIQDIPKDLSVGFLKILAKSEENTLQSFFRQISSSEKLRKLIEKTFSNIGSETV